MDGAHAVFLPTRKTLALGCVTSMGGEDL